MFVLRYTGKEPEKELSGPPQSSYASSSNTSSGVLTFFGVRQSRLP
jgi:hypothetical protein